ncbi:MAG: DUF302 domain-containing protein [Acidobacteriota bacterium]
MGDKKTGAGPKTEAGIGRTVDVPFKVALERIEQTLSQQGFGVLTRIDVQETLKQKLGVDQSPFVILGACNPALAHRALVLKPEVGLLLPCNVVVREVGPGKTRVEAINPSAMMSLFPDAGLDEVAAEAARRLSRAIESF